jgi:plastocyanin
MVRPLRGHGRTASVVLVVMLTLTAACGGDDAAEGNVAGNVDEVGSTVEETTDREWRSANLPGVGSVLGTSTATYEYVIPDGASDRMAAGEDLDIVPGRFTAKVGESVKIVNHDRRGHNVGLWYVGPGETVIQKFTSPGRYEGLCTVHPSGALVLEVTDA